MILYTTIINFRRHANFLIKEFSIILNAGMRILLNVRNERVKLSTEPY